MKKKQLFDTRRKVPFSPIVDKDAICDSDGNPLDALYATKKELAAKQDTLKAGKGIIIKGGVISSTVDSLITPITYAELVALRDSSSLVAGMQYRITDYDFTTTRKDTDSAHKLFDIIVTADSESVLNESARATHHQYAEGKADSLLSRDIASWELKYTLENIKHSSSNGKGTVLWMKDEYRNECNYDFINALFRVYKITACAKSPSLMGTYAFKTNNSKITYGTNSKLVSTFGANNYDNIIKFDGLAMIVLGDYCHSNTFGYGCYSNTFGNSCHSNTFGDGCYSNIFGNFCHSNTFGDGCYSNIFGNYYTSNTFRENCFSNTFNENCSSNTFGDYFYTNTFGNYCYNNTFGGNCKNNTFGDYCKYNTFGHYCKYIIFAASSSAIIKYNYYQYNHFGDVCEYILFKGAETASDSAQVQNYNFAQGVHGESNAFLKIDGVRSRAYETKVAKNSSGELKIYCEADLIQ